MEASDMKVATIKVTVTVMCWLQKDFGHEGQDTLVIEETIPTGASIMDLLHALAVKYSVFGKKAFTVEPKVTFDYCAVICNGTFIADLAALDTELKEGDTIKLIPGLYGG